MLLCAYCVGQSPKMGNANGFWHHCRDSGIIIILASSTVGSMSESFSIICALSVYLCVYVLCVCDKEWKLRIPVVQILPESLSSHHLL